MDPKISLAWNSHEKSICNGLAILQQRGEFVDMTLAADGHHVKVHQMVMSLVSPYIKELITSTQCSHPVIFLNRVSYQSLQAILEYAYTGEVLLPRESLYQFLEACKVLHIRGLEDEYMKTNVEGAVIHSTKKENETTQQGNQESAHVTSIRVKRNLNANSDRDQNTTNVKRLKSDVPVNVNNSEVVTHDDFSIDVSHISDNDSVDFEVETIDREAEKPPDDGYITVKKKHEAISSTLQYSLSCQGSIQIILNRYLYRLRHARKNNEKMWRCADYNKKGCPAYVITKGDIVLERGCAHSHAFHDKQILKRLQNGNIYAQFNSAQNIAALNKTTHQDTDTEKCEESAD